MDHLNTRTLLKSEGANLPLFFFSFTDILVYGEGNEARLTGRHETGSIESFTYGVANRGASIRIPRECAAKGYGYFEDRRPASNADPYQITGIIMETIYGAVE